LKKLVVENCLQLLLDSIKDFIFCLHHYE